MHDKLYTELEEGQKIQELEPSSKTVQNSPPKKKLPDLTSIPADIKQEFDDIQNHDLFPLIFVDILKKTELPPEISSKISTPLEHYAYLRMHEWEKGIPDEFFEAFYVLHCIEKIKECEVEPPQLHMFLNNAHAEIIQFFGNLCSQEFRIFSNINVTPLLCNPHIIQRLKPEDPKRALTANHQNTSSISNQEDDIPIFLKTRSEEIDPNNFGDDDLEDEISGNPPVEIELPKAHKGFAALYQEKLNKILIEIDSNPDEVDLILTKYTKSIEQCWNLQL